MKNTSFKRLWTVTSLKRIRKAFLNGKDSFICLCSPEFESIWRNRSHRKEICDLGLAFSGIPCGNFDMIYASTLFRTSPKGTSAKELRLNFLDHEIKRLSEKLLASRRNK